MRVIKVLFYVAMLIFLLNSAYAGDECWFVETLRTYDYTKDIKKSEKNKNPFREEKEQEKMHHMLGVRLLFKESGELLKVLGYFANGNYTRYKYKYSGWRSQPCPRGHPKEVKRPGDWSKYEENVSGTFELEHPHAGGVFMKLGNHYQLDIGVSKLIWKTQSQYQEQHYDACSGNTTENNKSWSGEVDVTHSFGHIPINGEGTEDGFSGKVFNKRERDHGTETAFVKWNIRKIPCDCIGLKAKLGAMRGDVKVNGKQITSSGTFPLDVGGGVIQTGKRSRVSLNLGDDITINLHSNSIIDLSTICAKARKTTFLNIIKGKLFALINKLMKDEIKVRASSAWIGVRGDIQSPRKIYLASIDPLFVLAMAGDHKESVIKEIRPAESEINKAEQAFFVDIAPYDHLYIKVDKGRIKISMGTVEKILSNGEDFYITLRMPKTQEEISDISIEPTTR